MRELFPTVARAVILVTGPLALSLLLIAAPALADRDCGWAPPEAMRCCHAHAMAYAQGGTEQDRHKADLDLYHCMVVRGVDKPYANGILNIMQKYAGNDCPPGAWGCWRYPLPPKCYGAWCQRR